MSPHRTLLGLLALGACAAAGAGLTRAGQDTPKPADAPAAPPAAARSADETAVRRLIADFAQAYNRKDADAVAALFTDDARIVDEAGKVTEGRAAIRTRFATSFENAPGLSIHLEPATIRFLTPDVAVEDGAAIAEPPKPAAGEPAKAAPAAEASPYTAMHVRRGDKWLTAEVRDRATPAAEDEGRAVLADLAWLAGDWVDEDDQGLVSTSCRWSDDHRYLLREFRVKLAAQPTTSGTQRIGWDPVRQKVRSWAFDSEGGFTEGSWTRVAPDRWVIKTEGYLRDGRAVFATNTLTRVSNDALRWGVTDRILGDEALDDREEVLVVRRPPAPALPKTK